MTLIQAFLMIGLEGGKNDKKVMSDFHAFILLLRNQNL